MVRAITELSELDEDALDVGVVDLFLLDQFLLECLDSSLRSEEVADDVTVDAKCRNKDFVMTRLWRN